MRINNSAAGWDNTHLVPVVGKLFATLKANNIGTRLLRSSRPGLAGSGRERETEAPMPAAEQNVSQIEVRMHDSLLTQVQVSMNATEGSYEPDHALLPAGRRHLSDKHRRLLSAIGPDGAATE
jgi:hypothetical protein